MTTLAMKMLLDASGGHDKTARHHQHVVKTHCNTASDRVKRTLSLKRVWHLLLAPQEARQGV